MSAECSLSETIMRALSEEVRRVVAMERDRAFPDPPGKAWNVPDRIPVFANFLKKDLAHPTIFPSLSHPYGKDLLARTR